MGHHDAAELLRIRQTDTRHRGPRSLGRRDDSYISDPNGAEVEDIMVAEDISALRVSGRHNVSHH